MKRTDFAAIACFTVSAALLLGAGAERLHLSPPADAPQYHQHVREVAAQMPLRFGNWSGTDVPLDHDVTRALHPNVLICRDYVEAVTGRHVWFLLAQCQDATALGGHYPPGCYPSIGYTQTFEQPRTWRSGTIAVNGAEYGFRGGDDSSMTVADFLELPDGTTTSDMRTVFALSGDLRRRFYGAAETQLIFSSDTLIADRQRIVCEFLSAMRPTIQAIGTRAGGDVAPNH